MEPAFQSSNGRVELGVASLALHALALALPLAVLTLADTPAAALTFAALALLLITLLDTARAVIAQAAGAGAAARLARLDLLFLPAYLLLLAALAGGLVLPVSGLLGLFGLGMVLLRKRWLDPARAARAAALTRRDRILRAGLVDPVGLEDQGLGPTLARLLRTPSRRAHEALARIGWGLAWCEGGAVALAGALLLVLLAMAAPHLDPAAFAATLLLTAQIFRLAIRAAAADFSLPEPVRDEIAAPPDDLASCLPALLAGLGWRGDARTLAAVLPSRPLDLTDLREALARLGYVSQVRRWRDRSLEELEPDQPPALLLAEGRPPLVVLPPANGQPARAVGPDGLDPSDPGRLRLSGAAWLFQPRPPGTVRSGWLARLRSLWLPALLISLVLTGLDLVPALAVAAVGLGSGGFLAPEALPLVPLSGLALAWGAAIAIRAVRAELLVRLGTRFDHLTAEAAAEPPHPWRQADGTARLLSAALSWRRDLDGFAAALVGSSGRSVASLLGGVLSLAALVWLAGSAALWPVLAGVAVLLVAALGLVPLALLRSRQEILTALTGPLANLIVAGAVLILVAGRIDTLSSASGLFLTLAAVLLAGNALAPAHGILADLPRLGRGLAALRGMQPFSPPDPPVLLPPGEDRPLAVTLSGVTARAVPWAVPVFKDFSLTVAAGEMLAVAGPPRAGTSTLLRLIAGLQPVEAGLVRADGIDLSQLSPEECRRRCQLVVASGYPRFGSVRAALQTAAPDADEAELRAACVAIGIADESDAWPDQWETPLEKVTPLPGFGFRLALACAFLEQPPMLLIDLGASRLDPAGEQALNAVIRRFRGQSTLVLVSTSPTHWRLADRVLLLERGVPRYLGPPETIRSALAAKVP